MAPVPSVTTITLRWLLRLRWAAVAGQLAALLFAAFALELELPWGPLVTVLLVTALSNGMLLIRARPPAPHREWALAGVIAADVLLLSVMIYYTGGASNPFSSFYLVLVALAAMALSVRWLTLIVSLAAGCYCYIFFHGVPLRGPDGIGEIGCPAYGLHLKGMAIAFLLTALCIAFFVQRMHRSLQQRDAALTEAESKAARAEQFSALAALAAGVAHELGSPLGTIAVATRELERSLAVVPAAGGPLEDVRLIRQEVERCRSILDRLDRRSTGGTGDPAEPGTAAGLAADIRAALPAFLRDRLQIQDAPSGDSWHLPRRPLVQSLLILIQNAAEADTSSQPVELQIATAGGTLRLTVLDRGPGMNEAVAKHAGEPFFTTKPPRHGMGLGLFLVRTLALQLGGELQLQPRPGGGTAASLLLPVISAQS